MNAPGKTEVPRFTAVSARRPKGRTRDALDLQYAAVEIWLEIVPFGYLTRLGVGLKYPKFWLNRLALKGGGRNNTSGFMSPTLLSVVPSPEKKTR